MSDERVEEYAGHDPKFAAWMKKVDRVVESKVGLSIMDLADQPFHDWFSDGMSPKAAAMTALEDEGFEE